MAGSRREQQAAANGAGQTQSWLEPERNLEKIRRKRGDGGHCWECLARPNDWARSASQRLLFPLSLEQVSLQGRFWAIWSFERNLYGNGFCQWPTDVNCLSAMA